MGVALTACTPPAKGEPLFEPARFAEIATEADRRGLQIAVHAIGDGAVKIVLDGYALESHNRVGLEIRGMLWAQPVPMEFLLRSRIDLEEGRFTMEDISR